MKWETVAADPATARPSPRYGHVATSFGSLMIIVGGTDGTTELDDVWTFNFGM